jgi:hypothetical protein
VNNVEQKQKKSSDQLKSTNNNPKVYLQNNNSDKKDNLNGNLRTYSKRDQVINSTDGESDEEYNSEENVIQFFNLIIS